MAHRTGRPRAWSSLGALFHGAPAAAHPRRTRRLALGPLEDGLPDLMGTRTRCAGQHHPREPIAVAYLFLLFTLWVINAIDLALTLHWTGDVGWAAEGNRIMRAVATAGGPIGFAAYKVLLMTFVVLVLWWLYLRVEDRVHHARHRAEQVRARFGHGLVVAATVALAGFYVWVIANNLHIMGYL